MTLNLYLSGWELRLFLYTSSRRLHLFIFKLCLKDLLMGLNVEGAQICLKDSSSRKLSDIIVNLDPVEEEVMEV
eukprot:c17571_g1_i2 orf=193-414(-)